MGKKSRAKQQADKHAIAQQNKKIKKAKQDPSLRKQLKKDPGVPNLNPAKNKLVKTLSASKRKAFHAEKLKAKTHEAKTTDLNTITASANKRNKHFEEKEQMEVLEAENPTGNVKDSSKKTFFREFKKVIKSADVILEVLDARDPLGSRSPTIERQIMELDPNKKIILILNKIDLIPRQNVMKWLHFLRDEYPTIAFKSTTQKQKSNLGRGKVLATKATDDMIENTSLGTETLMQLLKNYTRSENNTKQSISVGVIGFPNVGKSSLINSLKRAKVVNVGARPGVTRSVTEINLDKNITLIDCPGIIFASDMSPQDAALRNCINFDQITDCILPIEAILKRCTREQMMKLYNIVEYSSSIEFLKNIAEKRGKILRGGIVDIESAARVILHDWNSGKIPYYTIPPESEFAKNRLGASIVTQWSAAFQLDNIMEMEKAQLDSLPENDESIAGASVIASSGPIEPDLGFLAVNEEEPEELFSALKKKPTGEVALGPIKERKDPPKRKKPVQTETSDMAMTDEPTPEEEGESLKFSADFWLTPQPLLNNNQ